MPPKKPFKVEGRELKLGAENIPTLEESLKHAQYLRDTKYVKNEKRDIVSRDTAERIRQIWIQDFGIPERCFRSMESISKQLKDHMIRLSQKSLKTDLKEVWMTKFGTIIDILRCR